MSVTVPPRHARPQLEEIRPEEQPHDDQDIIDAIAGELLAGVDI